MGSMFKGIKESKPMGARRDAQAKPGTYWVRLDSMRRQESAKPPRGREFISLEATVVKVIDDQNGLAHSVGHEFVELLMNYGPAATVFLSKINGILTGILNTAPDEEDCDSAISNEQPLKSLVVEMSAVSRPFKNKEGQVQVAVNRNWIRSLSKSEVEEGLDPATIKRFFPAGVVENPFAPDNQPSEQTA